MADPTDDPESGDDKREEPEFIPPKDGSWIPKKRFDEKHAVDQARIAALEAQVTAERTATAQAETKAAATQPEPKKRFTRAELARGVEQEQITQAQSDEIWDNQRDQEIEERIDRRVEERTSAFAANQSVERQIQLYQQNEPDVMVEGSDIRSRVAAEYQHLRTEMGMQPGNQTQLLALRSVLGPPERLAPKTREARETYSETGGGGEPGGEPGEGTHLNLDSRRRAHYQRGIDQGRYKDWAEVEAELKFAKPPAKATIETDDRA